MFSESFRGWNPKEDSAVQLGAYVISRFPGLTTATPFALTAVPVQVCWQQRFSLDDSYANSLPEPLFSAIPYTKHTSAPLVLLSLLWTARSGVQDGVPYGIYAVPCYQVAVRASSHGFSGKTSLHDFMTVWKLGELILRYRGISKPIRIQWLNPPIFHTLIVSAWPLRSSRPFITTFLLPSALSRTLFFFLLSCQWYQGFFSYWPLYTSVLNLYQRGLHFSSFPPNHQRC